MVVDPKQVLSSAADVVLDSSPKVKIKEASPSLFSRFLAWLKIRPLVQEFSVKPLVMGNLIRISKLCLDIDFDIHSKSLQEANLQALAAHGEAVAQIVAIALTNKRAEPKRHFVNYLLRNLSAAEMLSICKIVVNQMDAKSFMISIISIKGMSLLKTGESIAPGAPSVD